MSELRWNPLIGEWVITATHRQERTFLPDEQVCPLCPSLPGKPPTEIPLDSYDIVVFENRFPSLRTPPPVPSVEGSEFFPVMPSEGYCEVVCYTEDHHATFADLSPEHIERLIAVWADRYGDLISRPNVRYVYIFENKGKEIGVTLTHPHGQIYAYPFIPAGIARRLAYEEAHFQKYGERWAKTYLREEKKDGRRVIYENEGWLAFIPFFARFPYEVHVLPLSLAPTLLDLSEKERALMAICLKTVAIKLDNLFGFSMPYVMSLYQHPVPYTALSVEFLPPYRAPDKLKYLAGSELGCGVFINDSVPEESAERLRQAPPQT
jgi:UDPglucose--hexose-1-phosphate uridylyltransferase